MKLQENATSRKSKAEGIYLANFIDKVGEDSDDTTDDDTIGGEKKLGKKKVGKSPSAGKDCNHF